MGQSNSRQRTSARPPPSTSTSRTRESSLREDGSSSGSERADSAREGTPSHKRSRRSSLRRSILGILPNGSSSSSSSTRTRTDSSTSNSEGQPSLRKRWRSSRRWSKAPTQLAELSGTAQESTVIGSDREATAVASSSLGVAEVIPIGTPSHTSRPSTPHLVSRPSSPRLEAPAEVPAEDMTDEARQLAQNINSWPGGAQSTTTNDGVTGEAAISRSGHPSTEDIEREVTEFLNGRGDRIDNNMPGLMPQADSLPEQPPPTTEPPAQQAPSPRHFPPPGTLVVVQGVVNTTDSPHTASQSSQTTQNATPSSMRPSNSAPQSQAALNGHRRSLSTPRNGTDDRRRHRLSSLIRPTSMLNRGPSDSSSNPPTSMSTPDFNPSDLPSTRSEPAPPTNSSSAASVSDAQATSADNNNGQRGLSQGSIDVLGTLLSVAAAATAASLFSPGVPYNNGGVASLNAATRPLSPTPTAGLGALGGLGGLAGLGLNPAVAHSTPGAPQDSRDRIRNMWESIRERVGLNPRNTGIPPSASMPGMGAGAERGSDDAGAPPRMRPGELMLAEMARALNAGLGLTNSGERRPGDQPGAADAPSNNMMFAPVWDPNQPLPPEGSFERFLVNLQADLRTVLADDGSSAPVDHDRAPSTTPTVDAAGASVSPEATTSTAEVAPESVRLPDDDDDEEEEESGPPALVDDDDSEEEDDEDDNDGRDDEEDAEEPESATHPPPRTPTPIPPTSGIPFNQEHPAFAGMGAHDEASRPAINLWRLYRFDPIPAAQTHDQAARTTPLDTNVSFTRPPPSVVVSPPTPAHSIHEHPDTAEPAAMGEASEPGPSQPAPATPAPEQPTNVVVPVIVVGLQSVDVPGQDEHDDEPPMPNDMQQGAGPSNDPYGTTPMQDGMPTPGRPGARGRTWQSRAANALRTLRPGRRATSRGARATEGSGSRTFLIYVIGGYYPPNHHMVTGSDTLDSYEALWELAELLGQVKPPTATKEDIDKSGLQIIKASELSHYEQEGRVSANCLDRCLVCLDDYDPDDDLRLMTCRHAFHKDCVDKWLQVGRNNCPACRTKGVSVASDAPPPPSPQMSTQS